jgi:hypothetical protein
MKNLMYIIGFACLVASIPSCKKDSLSPNAKAGEPATVSEQQSTLSVDEENMGGKVTVKLISSPGKSIEEPNLPDENDNLRAGPPKMIKPNKNFSEVNVHVQKLRVHTPTNGWMDLETKAGIYNLISLQNHIGTLLTDKAATEGSLIDKMELVLGRENSVVMNGVRSTLIPPNPDYAPILINIDAPIDPRKILEITIDFKAHASVNVRPKPNDSGWDFFLEPVISVKDLNYTNGIINL